MTLASTFFFCHVFGKKVLASEGKTIGRLEDLIADPAFPRPQIIAAVVSGRMH
jgi:sporulation protein YlmC with PRC-barrel domain